MYSGSVTSRIARFWETRGLGGGSLLSTLTYDKDGSASGWMIETPLRALIRDSTFYEYYNINNIKEEVQDDRVFMDLWLIATERNTGSNLLARESTNSEKCCWKGGDNISEWVTGFGRVMAYNERDLIILAEGQMYRGEVRGFGRVITGDYHFVGYLQNHE